VNVQSEDAFVHQLTVAGGTAPITLSVKSDKSVSATVSTTINNQGVIELDSGELVSATVIVGSGGLLSGNGSVVANNLAVTQGTISPGFGVGQLDVTGNVELGQRSTLVADVDGLAGVNHDTIDVTGDLDFGGTLQVVIAPTATLQPGDTFTLFTADSLAPGSAFDRVETLGSDDLFVAIEYPHIGLGIGSELPGQYSINGRVYERGDMNHDSFVNSTDISFFATALSDPEKYFTLTLTNGACICDFGQAAGDLGGPEGHPDGALTFDDIAAFATKLGMSQGAFLDAMSVPEPACAVLLLTCSVLIRRKPDLPLQRIVSLGVTS
jgi:hypothetical protein